MDLPDDSPQMPKLPFILGDLALLAVAAFLAYTAGTTPSTANIVGIVICAGLGVALGVAPFVLDYAREQDLMLRDRERLVETLVRTTSSAADQASIAANGLNEIAETTKSNLRTLEALPDQIAAARQAASQTSGSSSSDELAALRARIDALANDLQGHPEALAKSLSVPLEALTRAVGKAAASPAPATPQPTRSQPKSKSSPEPQDTLFAEDSAPPAHPAAPSEAPSPATKRTRKPKKSAATAAKTESPPPVVGKADGLDEAVTWDDQAPSAEIAPAAASVAKNPAAPIPDAAPDNDDADTLMAPDAAPAEKADKSAADDSAPEEPALSSDGMTRLTVTAYIGIGNRLFIRGKGPGLRADEGVPLQFVSIGKWRWETDAAAEPITATLWKNDEELCTAAGEITLRPGAQLETAASF